MIFTFILKCFVANNTFERASETTKDHALKTRKLKDILLKLITFTIRIESMNIYGIGEAGLETTIWQWVNCWKGSETFLTSRRERENTEKRNYLTTIEYVVLEDPSLFKWGNVDAAHMTFIDAWGYIPDIYIYFTIRKVFSKTNFL